MVLLISKQEIIAKAIELGFEDIGFTTADPFTSQIEILNSRKEEYTWAFKSLNLMEGIDPKRIMPSAKSILVLITSYFKNSFPKSLESYFGRCYLDDDRITKDGLSRDVKKFRVFLRDNGIDSKFPAHLPHRLAAARAGLGTFGKNCLFYSRKAVKQGSWILPIPLIVDQEFEPDKDSSMIGCPDWCKNACITACPTGALKGPRNIDPRKCISYLTYFGEGLTPKELREPMGLWVYGCDHCQNVCPRNRPWLVEDLPLSHRVTKIEEDFELSKILHMDRDYYRKKIWPHMFYMGLGDIWRWKMNIARVMGNSLDPKYVPDLIKAFKENKDLRVKCMVAWSLGRIGGLKAQNALKLFLKNSEGQLRQEIEEAIEHLS